MFQNRHKTIKISWFILIFIIVIFIQGIIYFIDISLLRFLLEMQNIITKENYNFHDSWDYFKKY